MTSGGSPPGGFPKCQVAIVAIFSCIPFYPSPSFPTLFPYFSPLPFQSAPPFPKAVNKKLNYRVQNALSAIKAHERNNDSEQ